MKLGNKSDVALGQRLIGLRERVDKHFSQGDWEELGLLTGASDTINNHHRLLLDTKFPSEGGEYVSAKPVERKITFAPHVFQVPEGYVELDLASVMMPFAMQFNPVAEAVKAACAANGLRCLRADDIWEESAVIQDIFNVIFRSQIVIVDFTGKNPNVMYETGIAHTLGKHVIPITQSMEDVPFDMRHHRVLKYLPNAEGFAALETALARKLEQFRVPPPPPPRPEPVASGGGPDDDIPF